MRRVRRQALWWASGVAVAAVALVAVLAASPAAENVTSPTPLLGKQAPAIAGTSITGGGRVSLAGDRGHYVVVNFFASWCQPCQLEEPQLADFLSHHDRRHAVDVLGVVFGDSSANAAAFMRENGATWPAVDDASGQIAVDYGVDDPPQSFIVDPSGRVVVKIVGGVTTSGLEQLLASASAASS